MQKTFLTGVFPIRAETQEGLTTLIVSQKLYHLPEDYLQTYRENVNGVTVEEVQRVAQKYIHPDKCFDCHCRRRSKKFWLQTKEFADEIEIFDTEGNKKDMEDYSLENSVEPIDISGDWSLSLNFQGQEFPVSLNLAQDGENISGKMESMLGSGAISDGKVSGNKFSAVAKTDFQGKSLELNLNGKVEDGKMTGTVNTPIIPMPIEFTGKLEK